MARSVVKKKDQVPAEYDYSADAGAGFEDTERDELSIPFLKVLQKMSPELEEVPKAKAGMMFNSVTEELFDGEVGVAFVPCHRTHRVNEWIPRDSGGGLVDMHDPDADVVKKARAECKFNELRTPDGNDLIDTYDVWGLVLKEDGTYDHVILSFTSTKIKIYRKWYTRMKSIRARRADGSAYTPPMWANVWRIRTVQEENQQGRYYNVRAEPEGPLSNASEVYEAAKAFASLAKSGVARADVRTASNEEEEKIPF